MSQGGGTTETSKSAVLRNIQSINMDQSYISQAQIDQIIKQVNNDDKIFKEIERIQDLAQLLRYIRQRKPSNLYFLEYFIIIKLLDKNAQSSQNLLDDQSEEKMDVMLIESIEQATICLDNIMNLRQEKEILYRTVLIDTFYKVTCGFLRLLVRFDYSNIEQRLVDNFRKTLSSINELLIFNQRINFKELVKINDLTYSYLKAQTYFEAELQNRVSNPRFESKDLIWQMFHAQFLSTNQMIEDLQIEEGQEYNTFLEFYQNALVGNDLQIFLRQNCQRIILDLERFPDRHYYYILYYWQSLIEVVKLEDTPFVPFLQLPQMYQMFNAKQESVSKLIQKILEQMFNGSEYASRWFKQISNIKQTQDIELSMDIQCCLMKAFSEQYPKYTNQIREIILQHLEPFSNRILSYIATMQNESVQFRIVQDNILFLLKFNNDPQINVSEILFNYLKSTEKQMMLFQKVNISFLLKIQEYRDPKLIQVCMYFAITISSESSLSIQLFISLIQELIINTKNLINNPKNPEDILYYSQILLFYVKCITAASVSLENLKKRLQLSQKAQSKIIMQKLYENSLFYYHIGDNTGTALLNQLLMSLPFLRNLLGIVCSTAKDCLIDQNFNILLEISYLYFLLYWKVPQRQNLQITQVQTESLLLYEDFYRFTLQTCLKLIKENLLIPNIYNILNNMLLIAFGEQYQLIVINPIFRDAINITDIQFQDLDEMSLLMSPEFKFQVIYNKYFEIVFAILFEVCCEDLKFAKLFYLNLLKFQLKSQIQAVLTFQELLPKFIFYFRIEKDQEIITLMKECLIPILIVNADIAILKQIFEAMSIHESVLIKLDTKQSTEELERAFLIANVPWYAIPLFDDNQRLLELVKINESNLKSYKQAVLTILDIISSSIKFIKESNSGQDSKRILHFQGEGSHVSTKLKKLTKAFQIRIKFQLSPLSTNQTLQQDDTSGISASFMSDISGIQNCTFIQEFEEVQILQIKSMDCIQVFIGRGQQNQIIIKFTQKTSQEFIYRFNIPNQIAIHQAHQLYIEFKSNTIQISLDNQQLTCSNYNVISVQINFEQQCEITLGNNLNSAIPQNQEVKQMTKSFINIDFAPDTSSFTGQIQEFMIVDKSTEAQKHQKLLELDLQQLDQRMQQKLHKSKFVNSMFQVEQTEQSYFKQGDLINSSNVYIIDNFALIELLLNNGHCNIFFLLMEIVCSINHDEINDEIIQVIIEITANLINNGQKVDIIQRQFIEEGSRSFELTLNQHILASKGISEGLLEKLIQLTKVINKIEFSNIVLNLISKYDQDNNILAKISVNFDRQLNQYFSTLEETKLIPHLLNCKFNIKLIPHISSKLATQIFGPNNFKQQIQFISSLQVINDDKIILNTIPKIKISTIKSIIIGLKSKQITLLTLDILQIFKCIIEDNPKDIFGQLLECKAIQLQDFFQMINNYTDSNIKLLMMEMRNNDPSYYSDMFFYHNICIVIYFIQYAQGLKLKNEYLNNLKFTQQHNCQIREKTIKFIINIFLRLENNQLLLKDFILQMIIDFYQQKCLDEKTKDLVTTEIANDLRKELNIENIEKVNLRYFMQTSLVSSFFIQIIPSQIINLNQSQNIIQAKKRNQALEIFTYIITFIIEDPNYCSTKTLNKYFSLYPGIFNKDLFQIYLSILVQTVIQYSIPFKDQETKPDQKKEAIQIEIIQLPPKFRNFIIALLQFELCIGNDIDEERVQWNYYFRLINMTIDLVANFNLLFQKFEYIPSFRQKIEFVNTQEQIMPNGGLFRLILNLILPYVHIEYQDKKMIDLLKILIEKFKEYQNKRNPQRPAYKFMPLIKNQSTKIQDIIPKQQEQDLFQKYFYDIILYQLLNTMNEEEKSVNCIKEFILKHQSQFSQVIDTVNANSQIDIENENEEFQNESIVKMIDLFHNKNIQFERALKTPNRNYNQEQFSPLPKSLQEVLNNYQYYHKDVSSRFLNIIYNYAYGPYTFINTLWLQQSRIISEDKIKENQYKSDEQLSIFTQRTFSSFDTQVQEQSQDQLWAKQAFELKLKNSLLYFLDNNLKALYAELDDFLFTKEFDFQVLSQVQVKFKIKSLEDGLRRRGQLKQVKGKDKPYIQQNKTFSVINGTVIQGKSKYIPSDSQNLSQSYSNSNVSPTLSRSNMQSELTLISIRKSSDTDDRRIDAYDFDSELITQEGSIFGKFTIYKKSRTIVFTVEENRVDKHFQCLDQLLNPPFKELALKDINRIMSRRYFLQEIAMEIFCQNKSYFFNFFNTDKVKSAFEYCKELCYCIQDRRSEFKKQSFQSFWQKGKISNFEYLMLINTYSGRTYNDLGQYFVFPWIISDYSSHRFELSNQNKYRDLRTPIGILDNQRKDQLKQRKEFMKDAPKEEYMHHGSHYSNSTIVMNYLLRLEPFNDLHYTLQKNRFDVADRLFSSIQSLWESSKLQDCKELIPEFYYMPEFLQNINSFDFGKMQSNIQVNDVDMPRWVKTRTAEEFVYIMRAALEGDITSLNLGSWINLIFGSHSIGKKAEESNNLFYYLTYESSIDEITANIKTLSKQEKESKLAQIALYGQVPYQLFTQDHEKKYKSKLSYFYQLPNFRYKTQIYDQKTDSKRLDECSIISIYFQSEANLYLLYSNFMMLCFGDNKAIGYTIATGTKYKSSKKIQFEPVPPNFNQQNLFCYINRVNTIEERRFFDNVDSQYHSNVHIGNEETYFAITGYSDPKIEIWNLKKYQKEFTITYKAKKYTCIKYHSFNKLLAVGSVDSCIYLWEVSFQNKLEIKSNVPKLIITNHKSAISCLDISDIYLLSVDTNLIGMVHTTTGNLLHQLNFNCESIITQCHIHPSQFFIFKCKKSILNVYTYNCSPYITNFELNTNNSFNLVFLTPFSSVFFVPSEESASLYTYDIFDIKCQQQSFTYNQKTLKTEIQLDKIPYERKIPQETPPQPDYSKKAPTALHVMLYEYEISENKHPEPLSLNYIIFFSQNGELFWLQEESQSINIDIGRKRSLDVTPTSFFRNILQADDRMSYS